MEYGSLPFGFEPLTCIKGLSNRYGISKDGSIYSWSIRGCMKPSVHSGGHLQVLLRMLDGRVRSFSLGRLVAAQFMERGGSGTFLMYLDGNKLNCSVYNLTWCSRKLLVRSTYRNKGITRNNDKLRKRVLCSNGIEYVSVSDAAKTLCLHQSNISLCLRGVLKTTGGLSFSYVE